MPRQVNILLVSVFVLLVFPLQAADRTTRIVGGTQVPDLRYTWMAAIYFRIPEEENFFQGCGGSLISDRWILSAAHCFVDADTGRQASPDDVAFLLGSVDLRTNDGIFGSISRIIVHPGYSRNTQQNDIALLELPEAVTFEPITLSNLTNPVPVNGEQAIATGWGTTSEGGFPSPQLLEVELPVVAHNACLPFYANQLDSQIMVCAGGSLLREQDACQGDSGGPLFVPRGNQFVQAGIVSFGVGCARPGIPGVYTRLDTYFDWISTFVDIPLVYDGNNDDNVVAVTDSVEVLSANTRTRASVTLGDTNIYQAVGVKQITLETILGDADLYVFNSAAFSTDTLVCSSLTVTTIDECSFDRIADYFIAVAGYANSDYTLTISDGDEEIVELEVVTLQLDNPASDNLAQDRVAVYKATSGNIATLTSVSGNADLSVFSSDDFNLDTLICTSQEAGSALDTCPYTDNNTEVFFRVFGATDTSYTLTISASQANLQSAAPAVTTQSGNSEADANSGGGSFGSLTTLLALLTQIMFRHKRSSRCRPLAITDCDIRASNQT